MTDAMLGNTSEASDFATVSTRQHRIAALARQNRQMGFTSLNQHLDVVPTSPRRCDGPTFPRGTEEHDRWAFRLSRTNCSSGRSR